MNFAVSLSGVTRQFLKKPEEAIRVTTGSVPVHTPDFEPLWAFWPKINWYRACKVGSQLEPRKGRISSANCDSGYIILYRLERVPLCTMMLPWLQWFLCSGKFLVEMRADLLDSTKVPKNPGNVSRARAPLVVELWLCGFGAPLNICVWPGPQ